MVFDDVAIEVFADEGEEEDGGEQGLWGSAAQFFDARLVEERADAEIAEKCGNAIINAPGLLQFANKECINHVSLFFSILLRISDKPTIPESKRLFTLKFNYYQHVIRFFFFAPNAQVRKLSSQFR